jgi:tRNA(Ile2) C34 agmatinyltransferase TiaS
LKTTNAPVAAGASEEVMNKNIIAGKHLDLASFSTLKPPRCPRCRLQMWWMGGAHGWQCPTCTDGGQS